MQGSDGRSTADIVTSDSASRFAPPSAAWPPPGHPVLPSSGNHTNKGETSTVSTKAGNFSARAVQNFSQASQGDNCKAQVTTGTLSPPRHPSADISSASPGVAWLPVNSNGDGSQGGSSNQFALSGQALGGVGGQAGRRVGQFGLGGRLSERETPSQTQVKEALRKKQERGKEKEKEQRSKVRNWALGPDA